jgi:hypothetical protein
MSSLKPRPTKPSRVAKSAGSAAKTRAAAKSAKRAENATVVHRTKTRSSAVKKPAPIPEPPKQLAVDAAELAKELEKGLAEGRLDILTPQALQALMAALCKTYAANIEAGSAFPLLADRNSVTSTDVMAACGALLKSADLQVFELGMWQSWTGR